MKLRNFSLLLLFGVLVLPLSLRAENPGVEEVRQWMAERPLAFIENKGQITDDQGTPADHVLFKAGVPGLDLYITTRGISYVFVQASEEEEHSNGGLREKTPIRWNRVDVDLKGASIRIENTLTFEQAPGYSNYYHPHCPDGILGVRSFRRIRIREVYPGIDWLIYVKDGGMKHDLVVKPGADPSVIRFAYRGIEKISPDGSNGIVIETPLGNMKEGDLYCYQQNDLKQVQASYRITGTECSYELGAYDRSQTLVIDPPLVWATYYGGSALDGPRGVEIDNAGNVLVAGYSASANFPTVNPGGGAFFQGVTGGASNATILKFSNTGVAIWATYYSGSNGEWAWDVACDNANNILVTGRTQSNNFPTLNPGGGAFFQNTMNGMYDGFILKFTPAGVRTWATIYGGNSADESFAIAADPAGNFAVVGCSQSTNLSLFNPGGGAYYQAANAGIYDLFILKFNPACNMIWGTNFGGNSQDFFPVADAGVPMDLCYDLNGNLFITGQTISTNFPTMNPGGGAYFQAAVAGGFDAFFLKFNPACVLQWSTYYGNGNGDDIGFVVKADKNGNIYATGLTRSSTFPTLNPGGGAFFQGAYGGGIADAFILKFTNGGVRLWATYYGGSARDIGLGGDINSCDHFYVTGCSASPNLATVNPGGGSFFDNTYGGAGGFGIGDMFILQFGTNCGMLWGTYLGGTSDEWGEDIAPDLLANLFIGGEYHTTSTGMPLINPGGGAYYQATGSGQDDGTYLKFAAPTLLTNNPTTTAVLCNGGTTGTATASISGGTSPYTYSWNPGGQSTQTITGLSAGIYTVTVSDAACNLVTTTVQVTQPSSINPQTSSISASCGSSNGSASVTASGGTGAFTYSWNPGGQTTATATGLSAGTYTITVTDNNGCTRTATATVTSNSGGTATAVATATVSCNGGSNGTASASMTGGTSPYTYSWNNGQTAQGATGLSAGTYTVIVTDAGGCTSSQTVSITAPSSINPQTSSIATNCGQSNGSASVTASGGTGALTYSWNPGAQTTATATGLSAGTYTLTVTDNNGCTATATASVANSGGGTAGIQSSTNVLCNGGSNGQATATMTGGTGPYTYSWNNGGTQAQVSNLQSGIYTVTVTDANGCSGTQTVNITQPAPVAAAVTSSNASCNGTDGTASVTASGGTAAYTYSWNNGQTTASTTGLSAGSYSVLITDNNGCTQTAAVNVGQNGGPLANAGVSVTITAGNSTVLNGSGGTNYTWSPSTALSCTNCANPTASPTVTTQYCLVVSDNNGCSDSACITVFVEIPCPTNDELDVPNAFSPNADGHNDVFMLGGWKDCVETFVFIVYNRWGEKVFETEDPAKGWDGTFKGRELDPAVFTYYISATNRNNEPFIKKGNISLVK